MREKPLVISLRRYTVGITPACAGKTYSHRLCSSLVWDHPRVCGKNIQKLTKTQGMWGSPPRVREKLSFSDPVGPPTGITPACAGKTSLPKFALDALKDHPRVCGKNWSVRFNTKNKAGSPPRVREKRNCRFENGPPCRITPACAGKTL